MSEYIDEEMIKEYLDLDIEELYVIIGSELSQNELGLGTDDIKEVLEKGEKWFSEQKPKIRQLVCGSIMIKKYLNSEHTDNRIEIISTIADIIAAHFSIVPIFMLSTLVFKEGLGTLCDGF